MSVTVKTGDVEWDVGYTGYGTVGALPTSRNFANADRVMADTSRSWSKANCPCKAGFVIGITSFVCALIAIGNSYSSDAPCDSGCVTLSVISGLSGITAIVLCCIGGCLDN